MKQSYYKKFKHSCPSIFNSLRLRLHTYRDKLLTFKKALLKESVTYCKDADSAGMTELAFHLEIKTFHNEQVILQQGEDLPGIILVGRGKIDVTLPASDLKEYLVERVGPGSSIGQYTILREKKVSQFKLIGQSKHIVIFILTFKHLVKSARFN